MTDALTCTITFERIGRRRDVPPLVVLKEQSADDIAEHVWRYAGRFLGSREYATTVNLETSKVYIEYGRFGEGVITDGGVLPRTNEGEKL